MGLPRAFAAFALAYQMIVGIPNRKRLIDWWDRGPPSAAASLTQLRHA
jgi:hypothetical protein